MNITDHRRTICLFLTLGICTSLGSAEYSSAPVDSIRISKSAHSLSLISKGKVLKSYQVAIGRGSKGPKQVAGDERTPEGKYIVDAKNASSHFHKALHLSYPNATDRAKALQLGKSPGGDIEIHGLPIVFSWVGTTQHSLDWTAGCIALSNEEIDEVWKMVSVGTPVEIDP